MTINNTFRSNYLKFLLAKLFSFLPVNHFSSKKFQLTNINNYQNFYEKLRIIICSIFLILISFNVFAQEFSSSENSNIYAVDDIIASASSKSPAQARNKAISTAQRNAFLILLERLEVNGDISKQFEDAEITDMISSKQILNEKIAGNSYQATLNLTFAKSFVKFYLDKKTAKVDEKLKKANQANYLIVPIKVDKTTLIWEENNDWRLALESVANNLTENPSFKFAKGDIEDISILDSGHLQNLNFSQIKPVLDKYNVAALLLVYFEFDSIENKANMIVQEISQINSSQVSLEFVNVNQLDYDKLLNKVADKTLNYIINSKNNPKAKIPEELKKPQKINEQNANHQIVNYQIDVLISNLEDWVKVKNKLENSNIIAQFRVDSIARNLIRINVSYNKNNDDIITAFAKEKLPLKQKGENYYVLSLITNQAGH